MEKCICSLLRKLKRELPYLKGHLQRRLKLNSRNIEGRDNLIINSGRLKNTFIDVVGNGNCIEIAHGAQVKNLVIHIRGDRHRLKVGPGCVFRRGHISLEDSDGWIEIGERSTFESTSISVSEPGTGVSIGDDCMFSLDTHLATSDSHSIIDLNTNKRVNYAKNIVIGKHVWVGFGVAILKGATIGHDSVIGACSVVTGKIPENSVAAGTPARVVRRDVTWLRERIYTD